MGLAMFTSGDYPSALSALRRAIQLNPDLAHMQSYYGQALALPAIPTALWKLSTNSYMPNANDYDANFLSASILSRRAKFAQAEPLLRKAVLLRPEAADSRMALADVLVRENKLAEAREQLANIIREWPEFGAAHARLAEVDKKSGLLAAAATEQALAAKFHAQRRTKGANPAGTVNRSCAGPGRAGFQLAKSQGGATMRIPAQGKPTVLVFGSYTCPNSAKPRLY